MAGKLFSKLDFLFTKKNLTSDLAILFYLALIKLLIPLLTNTDFGLHRDEFLYLAMGDHPNWGYLEVPPSIGVFATITTWILGKSVYAVRFFPALTGAMTLFLTGLIAKELGGKRFAQVLAVVIYLFSLLYLRINLLFQPVTFNLFYFILAVYLFIRILKNSNPVYWIFLGITVGLGLLNKYTMLMFGFGAASGLLFTPHRKLFLNKWLWISSLIALAVFLPNLIWQHMNNWPFFEHMQVLSERQLQNVNPFNFLLVQLLMNLYSAPVWLAGLFFLFIHKEATLFRPLAWVCLSMLLVLLFFSGKAYYMAPAYPILFASGSVWVEKFMNHNKRVWLKPVLFIIIIGGGLSMLPVGLTILPVEGMIRYFNFTAKYMGTEEALRWEGGDLHELPQDYADMLGWEEQVADVARIYHGLNEDEQGKCAIFASNYGEAGAVDYYCGKYNLPKCISKGSTYWTWGYRSYNGAIMIIIGWDEETMNYFFKEYELTSTFTFPHARENGIPIYLARNPKMPIKTIWEILKKHRY